MKKFLIIFLIFSSFAAIAQPYFFTELSQAYQPLASPTVVSGPSPWTSFQSFSIPIGFTFNFMGNLYTSINIEGSGFTFFDLSYYYLINPFTVQLRDKGSSSSLSPLSYEQSGTSPNRMLKIEWSNCGFVNEANSTANFQLWLYENQNKIEVHIGNCTVVNPTAAYTGNGSPGPVIGIFEYASANNCTYSLSLYNTPANIQDTLRTGNISFFGVSLNGTPASGAVYRFTPSQLGMEEGYSDYSMKLYPNPCEDILIVQYDGKAIQRISLLDLQGRILMETDKNELDVRSLVNGMYVCRVTFSDGVVVERKVVRR